MEAPGALCDCAWQVWSELSEGLQELPAFESVEKFLAAHRRALAWFLLESLVDKGVQPKSLRLEFELEVGGVIP